MRLFNSRARACHQISHQQIPAIHRRFSDWAAKITDSACNVQSYVSKSRDPFVNLSIEHYLFQKSPPGSRILFLYTNRPSIVIGRNQNPWLEVNLNLLRPKAAGSPPLTEASALGPVDLVRRRSGGGTVFHDEGNVNWSVICDAAEFTRDKHAEMVVRSLRQLGVDRARVNERHDIVLDQGTQKFSVDKSDTHKTTYTNKNAGPPPLKVSGSAYKLSRNRALHHGTALLQSPNLDIIPHYLHSPAKNFITAKGVESVSSPVGNIGIGSAEFEHAVQSGFASTYGSGFVQVDELDDSLLDETEVKKGYAELTVSFNVR
jgi:lipoate-protein ligase A